MPGPDCAVFPTAIGPIGIAWSEHGILGVQLPVGGSADATERSLRRRYPAARRAEPDGPAAGAIAAIARYVEGDPADLAAVAIAWPDGPAFDLAVWRAARAIPYGETLTYGAVAARLGEPNRSREVGAALGRNPVPILVPCHRVLAAGSRTGGFSAPGGVETKLRLLAREGAAPGGQPDLFASATG